MNRIIRYQGAIIQDDQLLLIQHREHASGRTYWVLPGGGREAGESEEDCVKREMFEETGLKIAVERLLMEDADLPEDIYQRYKTYLCRVISGEAKPGYEPEEEAASWYAITQVRWFDLRDPVSWLVELEQDKFTLPLVQRICVILGYSR
jgi:ADP-ribose pyrophosphatase YjhB (NUDIX family)